jgi:homoserine O-acetyltransferase/O-succinyltransferase
VGRVVPDRDEENRGAGADGEDDRMVDRRERSLAPRAHGRSWPDGKLEAGWAAWTAIMQVLAGRTPEKLAAIEDPVRHIEERTRQRAASGFDAVDWVYQTWAYDAHDVGDLAAIEAETLVMAPPVDLYNPAAEARRAAREIRRARFIEIPTADGHQCASGADVADTAFIDRAMAEFLSS